MALEKAISCIPLLTISAQLCGDVRAAGPVTLQNSTLSVPAFVLASTNVPGSSNLVGQNFILSSVSPTTRQNGRALLLTRQQWARHYDGSGSAEEDYPYAAAMRADGSVVVTGSSRGSTTGQDFATVCYQADGTPLWTNRYDGPAHMDDMAELVKVNETGEVWVAGSSRPSFQFTDPSDVILIKYAASGAPVWTNRCPNLATNVADPAALAVDAWGHAYVVQRESYWQGGSGQNVRAVITKIDPLGQTVWAKDFYHTAPDSGQGVHNPGPLALDEAGNLFLAGDSGSQFYLTGSSIVKYGADGTALWTNHFGFGDPVHSIRLVSADRHGDIVVTGQQWTMNTQKYVVIKLSQDGTSQWTNVLAGPQYDGGTVPQTLTDSMGNVFLIGGSVGAYFSGLYQMLKIDGRGVPFWTNQVTVFGSTNLAIPASAIDSAGNLYLAGSSLSASESNDFVAAKLNNDGQLLWINRFHSGSHLSDHSTTLAVDAAGRVSVIGYSISPRGDKDFTVVQYAEEVHYTPPADFTGLDAITVTLTDRLGNQATGEVEIVVVPGQFNLSPLAARLTPEGMQLEITVMPGSPPVVLEASADFISWQPIATNTSETGIYPFLDPTAAYLPRRYYRAFQRPEDP